MAIKFVHSLKLNSGLEWREYGKSGKLPSNIPITPWVVYKDEWKGIGHWLGTGKVSTRDMIFLSFKEACLGTEIELPNLKGSKFKVKIEPGTPSGKILRLKGRGIPEFNGISNGDILIKVNISIPTNLNEEQIKALDLF